MKKICLALLLVLTLSVSASADVAFTVVDNLWTSGAAGLVTSDAGGTLTTTANVVTGLNADHAIYSFHNANGKSRVMLSQYTLGQPDTVWIYDPAAGDWSRPIEKQWTGMSNRRSVATIDSSLFAIGYDAPTVVKVDMTNESYSRVGAYTFTSELTADGYRLHGERLVAVGESLFALFTAEKGNFPNFEYAPSKLVKLDTSLNVIASADLGKNAVKMDVYDGKIYVACIGGSQQYGDHNADSMLQMVDAGTMAVTTLMKGSEMGGNWASDFHDIVFTTGGKAYVLAGAYDAMGMNFEGYIYETTAAKLQTGDIGTEFADTTDNSYMGMGWTWGLYYDAILGKLVAASGMLIMIYDPTGAEPPVEVGALEIQGNLCSVCVIVGDQTIPVPPANTGSGGGGGCNAGFGALALVALLPVVMRRKKQV